MSQSRPADAELRPYGEYQHSNYRMTITSIPCRLDPHTKIVDPDFIIDVIHVVVVEDVLHLQQASDDHSFPGT